MRLLICYPKYVVTLDEFSARNINGVKVMHLANFCWLRIIEEYMRYKSNEQFDNNKYNHKTTVLLINP